MSLPVVTVAAMHNLFVCTRYFLALPRISCPDSGRVHQCSTCVYSAAILLCGTDLVAGGLLLVVVSNRGNRILLLHLDSNEMF